MAVFKLQSEEWHVIRMTDYTEELAFCVNGLGWVLGLGCFKHFFGSEEALFCVLCVPLILCG